MDPSVFLGKTHPSLPLIGCLHGLDLSGLGGGVGFWVRSESHSVVFYLSCVLQLLSQSTYCYMQYA